MREENKSSVVLILSSIISTMGIVALLLSKTVVTTLQPEPQVYKKKERSEIRRIIFVTIDTLRHDHVGCYGYIRNTTPFIDSLSEKGIRFKNAFSASSHTAPSHASMFTSLYPFEHDVLTNGETMRSGIFTLRKMAQDKGMATAAFPAVKFLRGRVGFDAIGEKYEAEVVPRYQYINAENNIDRVIRWLEDNQGLGKMFLWIHFYDVHQWRGRSVIPDSCYEMMRNSYDEKTADFIKNRHNIEAPQEKAEKMINNYDALLLYVDKNLERLYTFMKSKGLNRNSLWIITSDHGEGLGNHNYTGHGKYLYNEQLHVPAIFHFSSGRYGGGIVDDIISTVDFLPTIAELLHYPLHNNINQLRGNSLVQFISPSDCALFNRDYAFSQRRPKDESPIRISWEDGEIYSIQNLDYKLIYHSESEDELFNLRKDPFELNNIINTSKKIGEKMKSEMLRIINSPLQTHTAEYKKIEIDKETLEELESLGYM